LRRARAASVARLVRLGREIPAIGLALVWLFGLVLAIGIVVDDAIVVIEAVEANMKTRGLSARDASFAAMQEVSGPVVAIVEGTDPD
jgi:multidrug efflux pump subunit AcrB